LYFNLCGINQSRRTKAYKLAKTNYPVKPFLSLIHVFSAAQQSVMLKVFAKLTGAPRQIKNRFGLSLFPEESC